MKIGAIGVVEADGLVVGVRVVETRRNFGRVDLLVTPLCGQGSTWVQGSRFRKADVQPPDASEVSALQLNEAPQLTTPADEAQQRSANFSVPRHRRR